MGLHYVTKLGWIPRASNVALGYFWGSVLLLGFANLWFLLVSPRLRLFFGLAFGLNMYALFAIGAIGFTSPLWKFNYIGGVVRNWLSALLTG
jgi:hypothetical protein